MSYLKWNNLIANYVFNEEMAGKEVLLFVDEVLINELGAKIGENLSHFISSVIEGPSWVNANSNFGVCQKALRTFYDWRSRKTLSYPPYLGYLALFVLAGYVEDENFSQIAYYPKLRALLGEGEGGGQYPSFNRMISLWMDLEKWSKEDKFEELGRFKVRIRGNWRHVGLPHSQTIISSKERKDLPVLFNRAGVISSDLPDSETIRTMLLEYGHDILSKKTLRLLRLQEENEHLLQALIDLVSDELNEWDGSLPEDFVDSDLFVKSRIKLCLDLNKVTKKATFSFRINAQNEFPNETLFLKNGGNSTLFHCKRSIDNWSTELKGADGSIVDGEEFNWLNGEQLEDLDNRWRSSLKGSYVRVFVEGKKYGLPNLVETPRVERSSRFILLCYKTYIERILEWGASSCETFRKIDYMGISNDWTLFSGTNPHESCIGVAELTLASEIKIRLVDGLRLGKGNTFFRVAPPKILLENCNGNEVVLLNEVPLQYNYEILQWELTEDLPLDKTLTIRVLDKGNEIKRTNFIITNSRVSIPNKEHFIETMGLLGDKPINIGVNVYNTKTISYDTQYPLPTYLSNEIIFIGQQPGEIFHWHGKTVVKLEWEPIWAIWKVTKRNWKAHFCGTKKLLECKIENQIASQKDLKIWKTVMCKMKKVIEKPEFPPLYELWESYLEVAKSVR